MGQFKPMVKMMTTEPTVELKLKKGGHVSHKHMKKGGKAEHGHMSMHHAHHKMDGGVMGALAGTPALVGRPAVNAPVAAPGRPSMAARRKAMAGRPMNTPIMKKGGKAHHHAHGGEVETPKQHKAEMHEMHKIEKELKHHEKMPASKAHHGLKKGGKVHHRATGGAIPAESTHGKYVTTEVHEAKPDHAKAHTGVVKLGNAGGFKKGGHVKRKSVGGMIPSETTRGSYASTEVHEDKPDHAGGHTGGVSMSNAGGFKKGGKVHKKAHGGVMRYVEGNVVGAHPGKVHTKTGEVSESTKPGEYKHGGHAHHKKHGGHAHHEMHEEHPHHKKHGGHAHHHKKGGAAKKYADGGHVQDDGRPVKMPQGHKKPTPPVDITMLSGTFKKGGHVKKKADGGVMEQYQQQKADEMSRRAYEQQGAREREENESLRNALSPARLLEKAREMFRGVGAVSDVEREKARTVVPAKKYGGRAC
jgi:hypothetical protein